MVESLIFDVDGTLWDSRELVAEGYNLYLEKEGLQHLFVNVEKLTRVFGMVMKDLGDNLLAAVPVPERYDLLERCMAAENAYLHESPKTCDIGYPKVKETIAELAKKYRLFIVSNSQCGYPDLCIDKLGLTPYIEGHLCYGDTGTSKGKTILTLMEKHNIKSAVYIGDIQGDYEATVEAGIPFVWCTFGFGKPEGYMAKVDQFEELLNLEF